MTRKFGIAFDYLCPWARNLHEHVVAGLQDGADWTVEFVAYSLKQGHVPEGQPPIWQRDDVLAQSGILALQAGITVRDHFPAAFLDAHRELYGIRHDRGEDLTDPHAVAAALTRAGLDGRAIVERASQPQVTAQLADEHARAVDHFRVWGVPTLIGAQRSVFIRVLDRPEGDAQRARERVNELLALLDDVPQLHEFKQTELSR